MQSKMSGLLVQHGAQQVSPLPIIFSCPGLPPDGGNAAFPGGTYSKRSGYETPWAYITHHFENYRAKLLEPIPQRTGSAQQSAPAIYLK